MVEIERPTPADSPRPPSLLDACIPAAALIVLLAMSYFLYGEKAAQGPNQVALVFAALVAAGVAAKNGISWSGLRQATIDGVAAGLSAIFIFAIELAVISLKATDDRRQFEYPASAAHPVDGPLPLLNIESP